jgi:glycosyltransferase involved in cell wall biosynthesis
MGQPVVIVSFSYEPRLNPRAFRWTAIAEHLTALGHPVNVVTSWVPDVPERETLRGVSVHRTGWKLVESARSGKGGVGTSACANAQNPGRSWIGMLGRWLWRGVCWPDVTANWYFPALRAAAPLLEEHRDAVLVSVAPSFTAVTVGYALKRRRANLPWVIDLGDPFSFLLESPPNNQMLYAGLNRRFERAAFRAAAAVSVTNRRTAERYGREYPESASKIAVIPPLLSARVALSPPRAPGGVVRIVYLGTLYRGVREPDFLLALFTAAVRAAPQPQLELHFYGDASACAPAFEGFRASERSKIHLHGVVSRDEAFSAMRDADVLVNVGNETSFQLPSKVVEYAAAGKPVVNIALHREDSSIEFFQSYPLALNIVSGGTAPTDAQAAEFRDFVSRPATTIDSGVLEDFLRPFRIDPIVARYVALFREAHGR